MPRSRVIWCSGVTEMNCRHSGILLLTASLAACSISQTINPVQHLTDARICIVENPPVKFDFLAALKTSLEVRGFTVKVLAPSTALRDCPITVTYTANWRWDLAMYMAYANIKVFNEGQLAGEAVYDSLKGGANMGKFIKGESKIAELVNQLFPA